MPGFLVMDNDGDTNTDSVVITVLAPVPNQVPVALISAIPTSGTTPLDVSFDGSLSYDGDGDIISYQWDFGDGNSGTGISTAHTYTAAGSYTAWLTVTDDDGDTGSDTVVISVSEPPPPPETDHLASGEIAGAGTASGDYTMTWTDDTASQAITERVSGGKKNKRFSYLVHTWQFSVSAGASVTVFANAWSDISSEDDSFVMEWSTNSSTGFQTLFTVDNDSASTQSKLFDSSGTLSGTVYIRVRDTDSTVGNTALDTVYIDQLYISTATVAGDPPPEPSGITLSASAYKVKGSKTVDLVWDGSTAVNMDIYRDDMVTPILTMGNDGAYSDSIDAKGGGSWFYKICEEGTSNCSDTVTVVF
jgi:PKD repeat protein